MYKRIILSSFLLGSFYLFFSSLDAINESLSGNKKMQKKLMLINCLIFLVSGFTLTLMYSFSLLNLYNFKSSRIA